MHRCTCTLWVSITPIKKKSLLINQATIGFSFHIADHACGLLAFSGSVRPRGHSTAQHSTEKRSFSDEAAVGNDRITLAKEQNSSASVRADRKLLLYSRISSWITIKLHRGVMGENTTLGGGGTGWRGSTRRCRGRPAAWTPPPAPPCRGTG
jgi:hypothetical protein